MNTTAMDIELPITEESGEQILRIPPAFRLSSSRVHLHRDSIGGPITISPPRGQGTDPELRRRRLNELFAAVNASKAAGETLKINRDFCPPRDVEI